MSHRYLMNMILTHSLEILWLLTRIIVNKSIANDESNSVDKTLYFILKFVKFINSDSYTISNLFTHY